MAAHASGASCLEDWLVDVAHARGAKVVHRTEKPRADFHPPTADELSNEDLVVTICMLQREDRPQLLRLAAQLVSRGAVRTRKLVMATRRERADPVIGEMARQALRVDPSHSVWRALADAFPERRKPRSPVIHWQRLAWPVMPERGANAERWELVK
jgi:hypothetical protein